MNLVQVPLSTCFTIWYMKFYYALHRLFVLSLCIRLELLEPPLRRGSSWCCARTTGLMPCARCSTKWPGRAATPTRGAMGRSFPCCASLARRTRLGGSWQRRCLCAPHTMLSFTPSMESSGCEMVHRRLQPNSITYTTIIDVFCRARELRMACGGCLVTVPEVLEEMRDAAARRRLALLRTPVETVEAAPEFVKKVVKFARESGDLQTLSDVDIKIIALAYMLEAEIHGTRHLQEHPPPLRVVSVRNLQEAPLLGWGSNVPNLAEWEALDQMSEAGGDLNSRILLLKDLENQDIPTSETNSISEMQADTEHQPSKKDACIPWEDDENNEGWLPAVSCTTHRKYLRRKARRVALKGSEQSFETSYVAPSIDDDKSLSKNGLNSVDGPSVVPEEMKSNTDGLELQEENEPKIAGDHSILINYLMGRMELAMLILLRREMLLMHALNNWIT